VSEPSIVTKIRNLLENGVNDECKVVYLLVECRKLDDTYPRIPMPFALSLNINWAVHIHLSYTNTTLDFLNRVDEFAANFLADQNFAQQHNMFRELSFLESFRNQLAQFLAAYDLPTALCKNNDRWHEFLKHYAGVIEDGSLSCQAKKSDFKLLRGVSFTKGPWRKDAHIPFSLTWKMFLKNDKTLIADLWAGGPTGTEFLCHSMRIENT
jgi:hypothetical protein